MFKLIAIREDGSHRLHLENLTTVAEAETALKFAVGQDGIVDGFVLSADEPIPASDGRTYAERVAEFHAAMAGFGQSVAASLRNRALATEDVSVRREMFGVADQIIDEVWAMSGCTCGGAPVGECCRACCEQLNAQVVPLEGGSLAREHQRYANAGW